MNTKDAICDPAELGGEWDTASHADFYSCYEQVNLSVKTMNLPTEPVSIDVCVPPELLKHVADWRGCMAEAARVLRLDGMMHTTTSSKFCPVQQELNLPFYSWYPGPLKRYFERRSLTDWPSLANFAKYPVVSWFTCHGLRRHLEPMGFRCLDRFDLIDATRKGTAAKVVPSALHGSGALRWLRQVITPYTLGMAVKGREAMP